MTNSISPVVESNSRPSSNVVSKEESTALDWLIRNSSALTIPRGVTLKAETTLCSYRLLSRDAGKPGFEISDKVRHKPTCTVTETG